MLLTLGNATVEVQVMDRADFGRRVCVACGAAVRDTMLCDDCDEDTSRNNEAGAVSERIHDCDCMCEQCRWIQ